MNRKCTQIIVVVAVVLAIVAMAWAHRSPDVDTWPRYGYFRCRDCGDPASVDPHQPTRWGCRSCRSSTFWIVHHFRRATRDDFPHGEQDWVDAQSRADAVAPPDVCRMLPAGIWSDAAGSVHGITRASAYKLDVSR